MELDSSIALTGAEINPVDFDQLPRNEAVFDTFNLRHLVNTIGFSAEDLSVIAVMAAADSSLLRSEYHNFFIDREQEDVEEISARLVKSIKKHSLESQTEDKSKADEAKQLLIFDYGLLHLVHRHRVRTVGAISRILEDWQRF